MHLARRGSSILLRRAVRRVMRRVMQHKKINPVVPTLTVARIADGAVCVITASEFDRAVYEEVVPSVGTATPAPPSKQARDKAIMRGVYGSKL